MSLRYKISLILIALITGYVILSYAILHELVFSSYLSFEKREARKDIQRCVEALRREIFHLNTVVNDWAAWNDMYEFVQHPEEHFINSNLIPDTFFGNHLDLICVYNNDKTTVWSQAWDRNAGKQIDMPEFYPDPRPNVFIFLNIENPEDSVSGVFMSSRGPMLVAAHPVTTSDHKGPIKGYFLMGVFLNHELKDSLLESTKVDHEIIPVSLQNASGIKRRILEVSDSREPVVFDASDKSILEAYTLFKDIADNPALLFKISLPRDIFQKGSETLNLALVSIGFFALLFTVFILIILRRTVISPLSNLTKYVTGIKSTDDPESQPRSDTKDEIGLLHREFTSMLQRIRKAHFELTEINDRLSGEICERKKIEKDLLENREGLRKLSVELQKTEERERRTIANDLHDGIGQKLALMQIKLDMLCQRRDKENLEDELHNLSRFMGEIIQDTRSLTFNISPPVLYDIGLEAAVEWLADDLSEKYGLNVTVRSNGNSVSMDSAIRITLYRAVRELLYNAIKHSGADFVKVDLSCYDGIFRVEVSDNGSGFEVSEDSYIRENGFGLFSIRENIRALGGSVHIDARQTNGSRIDIILPVTGVEQVKK